MSAPALPATIGDVAWTDLLDQAHRNAALGGAPVPGAARDLADLAVSGPAEILTISRAAARRGTLLLSSGGTTGSPKLTYVPCHQALGRLGRQWRPLHPGDVLLNLFTPGRLWASHYYMQTLAEQVGCTVLPAGPYEPADAASWLPMFTEAGVTAMAGTPTALADLARAVLDAGHPLRPRKLIWMAEPWTAAKEALVRAAFPGIEFWGNYGSVETYVIATNGPRCDVPVLHLMPGQVLELDDDGALLSRAGDGWTVPVTRYRLGDRLAPATCRCGRPDGLRVVERADDAVKLAGALIAIGDVLRTVRACAGVDDVQLLLTRDGGETPHGIRHLDVTLTGPAAAARVREILLRDIYDLGVIARQNPSAITVRTVAALRRVTRTNKVPPMIWETNRDHPA